MSASVTITPVTTQYINHQITNNIVGIFHLSNTNSRFNYILEPQQNNFTHTIMGDNNNITEGTIFHMTMELCCWEKHFPSHLMNPMLMT